MIIDCELLYDTAEKIAGCSSDMTEIKESLKKNNDLLRKQISTEESEILSAEIEKELSECAVLLENMKMILVSIADIYSRTDDELYQAILDVGRIEKKSFPIVNEISGVPGILLGDFE